MNTHLYLNPISAENPCGDDPRYLDEFELIKTEVEKLAGCDFALVLNRARYILAEQAKDLRVAGFLLLALCYEQGVQGLLEGLAVYKALVQEFADKIHPRRLQARQATIAWLNNPRVESFIKESTLDEATFKMLGSALLELNQCLQANFGEDSAQFTLLNGWLKRQQPKASETSSVKQILNKVLPKKEQLEPVIDNEKNFTETTQKLVRYCRTQDQRLRAMMFARALRWGVFSPIAHTNYQTQLPPLRKEALEKLARVLAGDDSKAQFETVEALFMEGSGQVFLDLQYHAFQALKSLALDSLAEYVSTTLSQLIKKFPELPMLCFSDGSAFACQTTRNWLATLNAPKSVKAGEALKEQDADALIESAKIKLKQNVSLDLLACLQGIKTFSQKETFNKAHAIAKALAMQKSKAALYHYRALCDEIERSKLALWYPVLAEKVWLECYQLLSLKKQADEALKETLRARISLASPMLAQSLF